MCFGFFSALGYLGASVADQVHTLAHLLAPNLVSAFRVLHSVNYVQALGALIFRTTDLDIRDH